MPSRLPTGPASDVRTSGFSNTGLPNAPWTLCRSLTQPLESISATVGSLQEQLVQLRSSLELLDTEPDVTEDPSPVSLGRARGGVAFENGLNIVVNCFEYHTFSCFIFNHKGNEGSQRF